LASSSLYKKILGSLYAGIIGDVMGAPTEQLTANQIKTTFGGRVMQFRKPPLDSKYAAGRKLGEITDDSGQMIAMARAEISTNGNPTSRVVADELIKWANDIDVLNRFAGPTTRVAIERIKQGDSPELVGQSSEGNSYAGSTSGAVMRVSPAGLAHPADITTAVRDAITMCLPTHGTQIAFSGAAAVASAVSEALRESATVYSVVQAGLRGAALGEKIGLQKARVVPGPSITARIKLSVTIALNSWRHTSTVNSQISDYIGTGIHIAECVPAAFGIFVANHGKPLKSIIMAVNIGGDTDTIATIVGSIAGALSGISDIPQEFIDIVEKVNHLYILDLASKIAQISVKA
jgi:ADP-ribosylglycohydrolase